MFNEYKNMLLALIMYQRNPEKDIFIQLTLSNSNHIKFKCKKQHELIKPYINS